MRFYKERATRLYQERQLRWGEARTRIVNIDGKLQYDRRHHPIRRRSEMARLDKMVAYAYHNQGLIPWARGIADEAIVHDMVRFSSKRSHHVVS